MINKKLKVKLGQLILDNPIIPASGTYGYGFDYLNFYDINILGAFAMKGTTLLPRFGNQLPRICEVHNGMINSVGLQNPGVDALIKDIFPRLKKIYHKKVVANIAAPTINEFKQIITKLNNQDIIGIYEINVSCPNVCKKDLDFANNPKHLRELIKAVKSLSTKPIFVKMSPQTSDIVQMAITAQQAGADGLTLINTIPGLMINLETKDTVMANRVGGMSGPAIKAIALRAIYLCYQAVKIPIIGCGGISNATDVLEFMYAGATAVQVGSLNLIDPYICKTIINDLPKVMKTHKINNLYEIIGKGHHG
jgi:dihydroorotate dehydrogenase (NAD+) catalytic subunit